MIKICSALVFSATLGGLLNAAIVDTTNPATVAAFQSGATVVNFENISGRTPQTITNYNSGNAVDSNSFIFDQIAGVQFSVGGVVGANEPALYKLSDGIAGDANSPTTVLGSVDFDLNTRLDSTGLIEIFFPTKVSEVGFWLNPSLGNVTIIALDTNFAFSHIPDTNLEMGTGTAGHFVGIQRPTADIGGFKIEAAANSKGFTIDDFTFGGGTTTSTSAPEPASMLLLGCGLIVVSRLRRR